MYNKINFVSAYYGYFLISSGTRFIAILKKKEVNWEIMTINYCRTYKVKLKCVEFKTGLLFSCS